MQPGTIITADSTHWPVRPINPPSCGSRGPLQPSQDGTLSPPSPADRTMVLVAWPSSISATIYAEPPLGRTDQLPVPAATSWPGYPSIISSQKAHTSSWQDPSQFWTYPRYILSTRRLARESPRKPEYDLSAIGLPPERFEGRYCAIISCRPLRNHMGKGGDTCIGARPFRRRRSETHPNRHQKLVHHGGSAVVQPDDQVYPSYQGTSLQDQSPQPAAWLCGHD